LRAEAITWREVDGEIVALELATSTYLAINRTGTLVWSALIEGASEEDLAADLARAWGISLEQAALDIEAFLASIRTRGLLEG